MLAIKRSGMSPCGASALWMRHGFRCDRACVGASVVECNLQIHTAVELLQVFVLMFSLRAAGGQRVGGAGYWVRLRRIRAAGRSASVPPDRRTSQRGHRGARRIPLSQPEERQNRNDDDDETDDVDDSIHACLLKSPARLRAGT